MLCTVRLGFQWQSRGTRNDGYAERQSAMLEDIVQRLSLESGSFGRELGTLMHGTESIRLQRGISGRKYLIGNIPKSGCYLSY